MRTFVKQLIPAAGREAIKSRVWAWRLKRAIEPLRANGRFTADQLHAFWVAWGNQGFSADKRYLSETIRLIQENRGDVLECGTGATTMVAGVLAERYQFQVYCLEQDPAWSSVVRRAVAANRLSRVHVLDTPLMMYGDYMWYDIGHIVLPRNFGLVICDGPYIASTLSECVYKNWRYGALPYLKQSRSRFAALLLDDLNDQRALSMLTRWRTEFAVTQENIHASEGDCCVIRDGAVD